MYYNHHESDDPSGKFWGYSMSGIASFHLTPSVTGPKPSVILEMKQCKGFSDAPRTAQLEVNPSHITSNLTTGFVRRSGFYR
jgi:hypothetical protein